MQGVIRYYGIQKVPNDYIHDLPKGWGFSWKENIHV